MELLGRIPLVPSYNARGSAAASASKDQRIINAIITPVQNALTGKTSAYLQKRQGLEVAITGNPSKRGTANYISPSSGDNYIGYDTSGSDTEDFYASGTDLGNPDGIPLHITESILSGTTNILVTTERSDNATNAYYYPVGGAFTQITDGDFPELTCGPIQELDGRHFIMTQAGVIHQSDSNSISSWPAGETISANRRTDKGRGLMRQGDFLVAFGNMSIEFFYNAGNASGSVLKRAESSSLANIGASAPGTLDTGHSPRSLLLATACAGRMFFVGSGEGQQNAIYELVGGKPSLLSTATINNMLTALSVTHISAFNWWGQTMVFVDAGSTLRLLYSTDTKTWYEVSFADAGMGGMIIAAGNYFSAPASRVRLLPSTTTTGVVWEMNSSESWATEAPTMTVQIDDAGFNTNARKFISEVRLTADTQASGTATLKLSTDDGATFSTMGTFDMTADAKTVGPCGSYKGHGIWQVIHTAATAFRATHLEFYGYIGSV